MHEALALGSGIVFGLDDLFALARVGGGAGVFLWTLVWLLNRGDRLQRENIKELRDQRDENKLKREEAEAKLHRAESDLAAYRAKYGPTRRSMSGDDQGGRA